MINNSLPSSLVKNKLLDVFLPMYLPIPRLSLTSAILNTYLSFIFSNSNMVDFVLDDTK